VFVTVELVLLSRVAYRDREITGPRLRGLLALLAADPRAGCGTARLVEGLWPDRQPENPTKALQVLVSRIRAQLGPDVVLSTPVGYRLAVGEDRIDASVVLLSAAESERCARSGDHAAALAHAETGLALWTGPAWTEADSGSADPLSALRTARASTYRSLVRARALALSRLGRRAEAVAPLTELALERPRDEEVLAELLRCEAATVGPSSALTRYDAYRRALRDELGTDPGAALRAVHRQLLQDERPVIRHGVPHEPNRLLGRDDDIAAVTALLRTSRVTSIVGVGGLGKTRLAHVVSRRAEQRVVHLVPLAGVPADGDVVAEVASALGVGEAGRSPVGHAPADVLTGILAALGPGPALLVLDNCEHVVRGAAELVRALVLGSRELHVLTTGRAPLGLSSESVYPLRELSPATAVELFGLRARAARPDVDLPQDLVRELCGHLDGLPLAVELAAARVRIMSVAEIARRLDDRFGLLRGGARDAPARHRTLHAVIDWSWQLLAPAGQAAMRALSVFPGGFTADTARHVLGDDDVVEVVEQLVDQSLLKVTDTRTGTRFRMLETVREFSTARRDEAGETDRATDRFLAWAREFGMTYHGAVFGPDLLSQVDRARAEQDNLVRALRHALRRGDGATVAATSAVLGALWTVESNFVRLAGLGEDTAWALSHYRPAPALVETTRTAAALGAVSSFLLRGPSTARFLVALRRLPPVVPDTLARAAGTVLCALTGGPDPSTLPMLCDSDQPMVSGVANGVASHVLESEWDLDGALCAARRALTAFEGGGTPWLRVVAEARIAELCLQAGRGGEARSHLSATLSVLEELRAWFSVERARWALVLANLQHGDIPAAEHWLERATRDSADASAGMLLLDRAVRAEILLASGDVDGGLALWRHTAGRLRNADRAPSAGGPSSPESWVQEVQAVTVVAHAQHGRLDLVRDIVGELPRTLSRKITNAMATAPGSAVDFPICGALLLALGLADLDRAERDGDPDATASGVRLIALALRLVFVRGFQPTMSPARATERARRADGPAYADAVSEYAGLGRDALRTAMTAALRARDRVTAPDPS
jgi:predicted ATPase/DNA-binding SARP family transcriptional activator